MQTPCYFRCTGHQLGEQKKHAYLPVTVTGRPCQAIQLSVWHIFRRQIHPLRRKKEKYCSLQRTFAVEAWMMMGNANGWCSHQCFLVPFSTYYFQTQVVKQFIGCSPHYKNYRQFKKRSSFWKMMTQGNTKMFLPVLFDILNCSHSSLKQLPILPFHDIHIFFLAQGKTVTSADCPNHISLEWKVAEMLVFFPDTSETNPFTHAEAVYQRSFRVTYHTHSRMTQVKTSAFTDRAHTAHFLSAHSESHSQMNEAEAFSSSRHTSHTLLRQLIYRSTVYFALHQRDLRVRTPPWMSAQISLSARCVS